MSAFLFGIGLTTLIYGPLSEGIGRKSTLLIGMILGLIGTALCYFSFNLHMLYSGRFMQGCTWEPAPLYGDQFLETRLAPKIFRA